jgi:hypothetical protein
MSAAVSSLRNALDLVQPDSGVPALATLTDIDPALERLREVAGLPASDRLSTALVAGFGAGWLHAVLRFAWLLEGYFDDVSTAGEVRAAASALATELRSALAARGIDVQTVVLFVPPPPGATSTPYDVSGLSSLPAARATVRRLAATRRLSVGATVDCTSFGYTDRAGQGPSMHCCGYEPSDWR